MQSIVKDLGPQDLLTAPPSPCPPVFKLLVVGVLVLCGVPTADAQSDGWTTSGQFQLAGGFTSGSDWSFGNQDWGTSDAFERSRPSRGQREVVPFHLRSGVTREAQLLDLIASAEAGPLGYDAIHVSARTLPPAPPTSLSVAEIFEWVAASPGQHHAIGRYQFIPSTLARLVDLLDVEPSARFTPALQDRLAMQLVREVGYRDFLNGSLGQDRFMDGLARVWAGLPLADGRSAYHGYAGNRATITRDAFLAGMRAIFGP